MEEHSYKGEEYCNKMQSLKYLHQEGGVQMKKERSTAAGCRPWSTYVY